MFVRGKFRHTRNPWFLVDNMEFLGLACNWVFFCGGPPFFSFHRWCTCHNAQLPNIQWLGQKINSIAP